MRKFILCLDQWLKLGVFGGCLALLSVSVAQGMTCPDQPELERAVRLEDVGRVQELLAGGADPNGDPEYAKCVMSPLAIAASKEYLDLVRLLLRQGANPNQEGQGRYFPLLHAVLGQYGQEHTNGRPEIRRTIVTLLLDAGANIHQMNSTGGRPIEFAIKTGDIEMVELLRRHGAEWKNEVSLWDVMGWGVVGEHPEMVKYLLNLSLKNDIGSIPCAAKELLRRFAEVKEYEERGFDLTERRARLDKIRILLMEAAAARGLLGEDGEITKQCTRRYLEWNIQTPNPNLMPGMPLQKEEAKAKAKAKDEAKAKAQEELRNRKRFREELIKRRFEAQSEARAERARQEALHPELRQAERDYSVLKRMSPSEKIAYINNSRTLDTVSSALGRSFIVGSPFRATFMIQAGENGRSNIYTTWPRRLFLNLQDGLPNLKKGTWYVISGKIAAKLKTHGQQPIGIMDVASVTACEQDMCAEAEDVVSLIRRRYPSLDWQPSKN